HASRSRRPRGVARGPGAREGADGAGPQRSPGAGRLRLPHLALDVRALLPDAGVRADLGDHAARLFARAVPRVPADGRASLRGHHTPVRAPGRARPPADADRGQRRDRGLRSRPGAAAHSGHGGAGAGRGGVVGMGLVGFVFGPLGTVLSELFPTLVRYSGASLTFNLAGILGASASPYLALWLAETHGLGYVGFYLSMSGLLSLVGLLATR